MEYLNVDYFLEMLETTQNEYNMVNSDYHNTLGLIVSKSNYVYEADYESAKYQRGDKLGKLKSRLDILTGRLEILNIITKGVNK